MEPFLTLPKQSHVIGVIESNRQIIRNESGKDKHKEFTGIYEPKPLKVPAFKHEFPAMYGEIPIVKDTDSSIKLRTVILWVVLAIILLGVVKLWPLF